MGGEFSAQTVTGDFRMSQAYKSTFTGVTFKDCRTEKSDYRGSAFTGCRFEGCSLDLCDFNAATIKGCEFVECSLDMSTFHSAVIEDSNFIGGRAEYVSFWNATLRRVKLDTALHGADLRFAAAEELDYGDSNLWGASINVNCVNFVDKEVSERQIQILLALVSSTKGNDELRKRLAILVDPHYMTMLKKLSLT
jgi:uncharacterized protein YjbI with pentapeptide repeats